MTWLLFKTQWRQFRNGIKDLRPGQLALYIMLGLLVLILFPVFIVPLALVAFVLPFDALSPLFSSFFIVAIAMTVLFAIPQVFKHLFSARDVELLFTLPVPTRSIFWVKYGQSFTTTGAFISLLLLLIGTVIGIVYRVSWVYYPVVFIVSLSVVLVGMAIAYLFNLVLIQILPTHRARELMVVMSGLAGVFVYVMFQLPNMYGTERGSEEMLANMPDFPSWLPTTWGAQALTHAATGDAVSLLWTGGIALLALGLSVFAAMLVERGFRTGWIRLSTAPGRRDKKRRKEVRSARLRHPIVILGSKEWRALQRDMREWLTFLPLLFVVIFPAMQFMTNPDGIKHLLQSPLLSWVVVQLGIIGFFSLFIGTFTAASIAREGKAAWLLRSLPLSGWQIALGKLWIHWLIPFVLVLALELGAGIFLGWSWWWALAGAGTYGLLSLGMSGMGLWLGTIGAKHNPDNPQDRLQAGTGFLLIFLNFVYLLVMGFPVTMVLVPGEYSDVFMPMTENAGGLIATGAMIIGSILQFKTVQAGLIVVSGLLSLLIMSLGTTFFFLHLSARRIDGGIQIHVVQGRSKRRLVEHTNK